MHLRKLLTAALVVAVALTLGSASAGTNGVKASAVKTVKVGPNETEVAGQFLFDPVVRSGKFIAGEFSCLALGINTKKIVITKCYLVLSNGATYVAKVAKNATFARSVTVVQNVPAINITQCITVAVTYKNHATESIHLASAPRGQPVLPCKLG